MPNWGDGCDAELTPIGVSNDDVGWVVVLLQFRFQLRKSTSDRSKINNLQVWSVITLPVTQTASRGRTTTISPIHSSPELAPREAFISSPAGRDPLGFTRYTLSQGRTSAERRADLMPDVGLTTSNDRYPGKCHIPPTGSETPVILVCELVASCNLDL